MNNAHLECGVIVAGRYRVEEMLGSGGHAVVWGAVHHITGKRVALKIVDKPGPRGLIEARAASHLAHPNVIRIHDVFEEASRLIIVMDWLVGESLATRLARSGAQPLARVVDLFLPVLEALQLAHRAGIVHRDLKPSNLFVVGSETDAEHLVLLDFGIAKILGGFLGETAHTESGAILGTPQYMAPEQLFGESTADARADLWSLGIVLAEVLSGKRPTDAPNVGGVLKRITTRDIVPLRTLAPQLPARLLDHVDTLLSFEPKNRPATVDSTIEVLRDVREGHAATATQEGAGVRVTRLVACACVVIAGATFAVLHGRGTSVPRVTVGPTSSAHALETRHVNEDETSSQGEGDADSSTVMGDAQAPTTVQISSSVRATTPPRASTPASNRRPGIIQRNPYQE